MSGGTALAAWHWHALRTIAARDPERSASRIRRLLDDPDTTAVDSASLRVMLAELMLLNGDLGGAFDAGAAKAAAALDPPDMSRLTVALLVEADLAVCARHPQAGAACETAARFAQQCDPPDAGRAWHAAALHAVATFHGRGRHAGLAQLTTLAARTPRPGGTVAAAVTAGLEAMRDPTGPRPAATLPAVPGGMLQPAVFWPSTAYLAYRVRLHPAAELSTARGSP